MLVAGFAIIEPDIVEAKGTISIVFPRQLSEGRPHSIEC